MPYVTTYPTSQYTGNSILHPGHFLDSIRDIPEMRSGFYLYYSGDAIWYLYNIVKMHLDRHSFIPFGTWILFLHLPGMHSLGISYSFEIAPGSYPIGYPGDALLSSGVFYRELIRL